MPRIGFRPISVKRLSLLNKLSDRNFLVRRLQNPGLRCSGVTVSLRLIQAPYPGLPIFSPYRADSEWDPFLGKTNVKRTSMMDDNVSLSLGSPILGAGFGSRLSHLGSRFSNPIS